MRPVSSQSEDGGRTYIEENRIFANLTAGGVRARGLLLCQPSAGEGLIDTHLLARNQNP